MTEYTWILSPRSLADSDLELSEEYSTLIGPVADKFCQAIFEASSGSRIDKIPPGYVAVSGASLYIPGVKIHINMRAAINRAVQNGAKTAGLALVLHHSRILDLAVAMTVGGIASVLQQATQMTREQNNIVQAILRLKLEDGRIHWWPGSEKIADYLGRDETRVQEVLSGLANQVVFYEESVGGWRVLW